VTHDRDTDDDYGWQNLHTHVFVAGTVENSIGERESHRVDRHHVCTDRGGLNREDNLHHIARREFEQVLDRTIGQEWQLLRDVKADHPTMMPDIDDLVIVRQTPEIDF
jgi:hypothetical protein